MSDSDPTDVSRDEFDALAARVRDVEQRQDAHAVVVAAALQRVESRLAGIDGRLDAIESRLGRMDDRFDRVDDRFDLVDQRLDGLDHRFDGLAELVPLVRAIARRLDVEGA